MTTQQYSVSQYSIKVLLAWVDSGQIAIPEIQRPFVWDGAKVRNFIDSLYQGFPVGFLITWKNPAVKLKDGTLSDGKQILIDGQQRVTSIMAALMGLKITTKDYERVKIRIAFNPVEGRFEVANPAIDKDPLWISDISTFFGSDFDLIGTIEEYYEKNPDVERRAISKKIQDLTQITSNMVGVIQLDPELDIETVTEIFMRVNSGGAQLSQADFAMSKIASNELYDGTLLRKAIDYFCHLAVAPDFYEKIQDGDSDFAKSAYFQQMKWLKNENDDTYDPSYTDMLRVAFSSEFGRGRLQDLVALLSGRNFETRQYEEEIAEASFAKLKDGVMSFMNETNFKQLVMIIHSAGFISSSLIGSQNTLNFAYILYLALKKQGMKPHDIQSAVRRWYVMAMLTSRYSGGSPETIIDYDIRMLNEQGFENFGHALLSSELSDAFWDKLLPQLMVTSSANSAYFRVFKAAQVKLNDKGFLSRDFTAQSLIQIKSDVHHLYPKNYLKKFGHTKGKYNQIANFAITQSEINISIGDRPPGVYFKDIVEQTLTKQGKYGGITDLDELRENLRMNCIPLGLLEGEMEYEAFLDERRSLIATRIKAYYQVL